MHNKVSTVHEDLVVSGHRTERGWRACAVAGPSCWNAELRVPSVGPETFAKH